MNKKIIGLINTELKEVKDKELLRQFYEICKKRQCPVDEIFNGIVLPREVNIERGNIVQALQEAAKPQEMDAEASETKAEEGKERPKLHLTTFKPVSARKRRGNVNEKAHEEVEVYETYGEDDHEQAIEGMPITTWSFNDIGGP